MAKTNFFTERQITFGDTKEVIRSRKWKKDRQC